MAVACTQNPPCKSKICKSTANKAILSQTLDRRASTPYKSLKKPVCLRSGRNVVSISPEGLEVKLERSFAKPTVLYTQN